MAGNMNGQPVTPPDNFGGQENIFEGIIFTETSRPGEYKSSAPGRKIMFLKPGTILPEDGRVYNVRIVEDTEPSDPNRGKYFVEIVLDPAEEEYLAKKAREYETIEVDEANKQVRIGKEYTSIFEGKEEKLTWQINANQFREQGQTMVEISFKRSDGVEMEPGGPMQGKTRLSSYDRFVPVETYAALKKENAEYQEAVNKLNSSAELEVDAAEKYLSEFREKYSGSEWILRSLRHLNSLSVGESDEILKRDPYFTETPYVVETMEKMTRLINRQRERKQGVLILEGDSGTGKNKMVDHFAHLTKRPIFRFACSAGKDEQDLKYLLEYDAKKGTYRIKSTVIKALETPGAILELDELNTLKPDVAKIFNPLFDDERTMISGEDNASTKAAEDVVLIGLQNPQHYMGVKPLAETIKSRARILEVSYPPLKKQLENSNVTQFRYDEAMIIRQHIPELKELGEREFEMLWGIVANSENGKPAGELLTLERKERIEEIKEIVEIANNVRDAYRAYHEGRTDEPIKFVFGLRESVEAAYELPYTELTEQEKSAGMTRAKKAVKEVILPKIPRGEERVYLSTLIGEI